MSKGLGHVVNRTIVKLSNSCTELLCAGGESAFMYSITDNYNNCGVLFSILNKVVSIHSTLLIVVVLC